VNGQLGRRQLPAAFWEVLLLCLCWLLAMITTGAATDPSSGATKHVFKETLGSAAQPAFLEAEGLAVAQSSEDILVIDGEANTVTRWNPDGTPSEFSALGTNVIDGAAGGADETPQGGLTFGSPGEVQIAVDNSGGATNGNIYVPQAGAKVVDVFAEDGSFLGQLTESSEGVFAEPCGVAVDPVGNVYIGDFSGAIHKYEPSASPPVNTDNSANFPFSGNCTLAAGVGPTAGFIFPAHFNGSLAKLDSVTGEEKYEVAAGPTTTVTVDPASGHVYVATGTEAQEYDASGTTNATSLSSFSKAGMVTGIAVDEASSNVYVARAGNPNIEVWGPGVLLPDATTTAASVVGSDVILRGAVSAAGGPPATCVFEFVEVHAEGFEGATSVPCMPAGPFTGTSSVPVSAEVTGLTEATYRFRLVASNENGSTEGKTLLFNTFALEPGLPDDRAYEMVSPPEKAGEVFPPEPGKQLGGRLTSTCPVECLPGTTTGQMPMQSAPSGEALVYEGQPFTGDSASGPNEYMSRRSPSGWETESLTPPLFRTRESGGSYKSFSTDLSRSVVFQVEPALSPDAPVSEGKSFANLYLRTENGTLEPLVKESPPNRAPGFSDSNGFQILFSAGNAGALLSPAFSHLLFEANDSLTDEVPGVAPEAPEVGVGEACGFAGANCNLYESSNGELRLVNVLPGNTETASGAVIGSGRLLAGGQPAEEAPNVDHAISDEGSRIFWSEPSGQVYVRVDGSETEKVQNPGAFVTASADGIKVLLNNGCLYDFVEKACRDLTEGQGGFQGILGASEDLSRIYFVDSAALTDESDENANGEHAEEGQFNLYVREEDAETHESVITFIGILLDGDNKVVQRFGDWRFPPQDRTAQVSADGRYLAFMSEAPLTGYNNVVRSGGCSVEKGAEKPCYEVFQYDIDSAVLSCASCNPSGERPLGQSNLSAIRPIPGYPIVPQLENLPANGEGVVFFESQDELSARDTNGAIQDVYQWKPNGVKGCERAGGCVALISSGHGSGDSMFLNSTPSGDDVFIVTRERLVQQDKDEQLDVYDARVGGGFEESIPSCTGKGCKIPSTPPVLPQPASPAFNGQGNPPRSPHCKRGFVRRHDKCVRQHKKHKKRQQRSAKKNRGGSR
jgi:hypothetical protein